MISEDTIRLVAMEVNIGTRYMNYLVEQVAIYFQMLDNIETLLAQSHPVLKMI